MKEVIIHCSDTPNGRYHTAEDIHRWHKERGFGGIGYHYVIRTDGKVESGRPEYWAGAHCRGHNGKIGICLIGRDEFTPEQEDALIGLLKMISGFSGVVVNGHYQFDSSKTCPGFDVQSWWENKPDSDWPYLEENER